MAAGSNPSGGSLVAAALRRLKPKRIIAIARDGEETEVSIVGERGQYERAFRTLTSLGAVQARCLDADGAVCEVLPLGPTDESFAPAVPAPAASASAPSTRAASAEVAELLRITLEAQDRAVARQTDILREVTDAAVSIMRLSSQAAQASADRADKLERMLQAISVKRERELAAAAERMSELPPEAGAPSPVEQADEMMMQVLKLAGGLVAPPAPAAPTTTPKPS